jgi:hypothetical protein
MQTQTTFITVTCDRTGCDKTATFEPTPESQKAAIQEHPWLNSHREVSTPDGRKFFYCSDKCEIENVATGVHNILQKPLIDQGNAVKVAQAAQAAKQNRQATEALKTGSGVTL